MAAKGKRPKASAVLQVSDSESEEDDDVFEIKVGSPRLDADAAAALRKVKLMKMMETLGAKREAAQLLRRRQALRSPSESFAWSLACRYSAHIDISA